MSRTRELVYIEEIRDVVKQLDGERLRRKMTKKHIYKSKVVSEKTLFSLFLLQKNQFTLSTVRKVARFLGYDLRITLIPRDALKEHLITNRTSDEQIEELKSERTKIKEKSGKRKNIEKSLTGFENIDNLGEV